MGGSQQSRKKKAKEKTRNCFAVWNCARGAGTQNMTKSKELLEKKSGLPKSFWSRTRRSISQEETDEFCKRIAENIEDEVLENTRWRIAKREAYRGRGVPSEWRMVRRIKKYQLRKWSEDCWARIFSWFREYNLQRKQGLQEGQTGKEEMRQRQRMKVTKEMLRKIRANGRTDANNSWWVSDLCAADCEKAWLHAEWEDTVQKWHDWLQQMKKKDKGRKVEEEHRKYASQLIRSADGGAGLLHTVTKPTTWRGRVQILKEEEEDAQPLARCEEKRKEWEKHWHCGTWRNEELAEEVRTAKTWRRGKDRSGGILGQGGQTATSVHNDFLLNSERSHE